MSKPGDELDPLKVGLPGLVDSSAGKPSPKTSQTKATPQQSASSQQPASPSSPVAKSAAPGAKSKKAGPSQSGAEENPEKPQNFETNRRGSYWAAIPSWGISTAVHVAALLALAAWNIEPIQKELQLLLNVGEASSGDSDLEEFEMDSASAELQAEPDEAPSEAPTMESVTMPTETTLDVSSIVAAASDISMPTLSQALAPSSGISAQSNAAMRAAMGSRSKETKREMLKKFGGTTETERAVAMALDWLAKHQNPETGAWTLSHSVVCGGQCDHPGKRVASLNAATGLALMCFLGAGQTHVEGEYKETVFKGLSFLIQSMRVQQAIGGWYRGDGHAQGLDDMYSHGIAAIAMCEAYGMTRDQRLLEAAQLSINFMTYAQNPNTGGWHYSPFPLGSLPGDTSVVGWQVMAIKSAAMSGLNFDLDTMRRANLFLDSMMVPQGFGYHYSLDSKMRNPLEYRPAMTACGVLCRMYSGWSKEHPTIKAAVEKFNADGPSPNDSYYNYYATQVMKQYGGKEWEGWNVRMRDMLVSSQVQSGHAAGSWYVDEGLSSEQGGRLYVTCMKTMMLEVYYRYMPLYAEQAEEDAFEL